jgi:hypothetical protein
MERGRLAVFGSMLGLVALFGCAPPPAPQTAAVPVAVPAPPPAPPAVPAPIALAPRPAPVVVVPPPPSPLVVGAAMPGHQAVSVAHRVIHHRWMRRYAALGYGPPCGSDAHPCGVSHPVVAIQ